MCHLTFRLLLAASSAFVLTVAAIPAAQAQTYNNLYSFNGQNGGKLPYAGVTIGPGGVLYGMTSEGGHSDYGVVYRLAHRGSGWILSTLYEFKGGSDGAFPYGGITFGPGGYMYGTTYSGGDGDYGTVFRMSAPPGPCLTTSCPWPETVIYRFKGGSDGAYPIFSNVVFDQAGNLYGTTTTGDTNGNAGTVFKLTPTGGGGEWTETILYSFTHGEVPYAGVTFDKAGNLYGTTAQGGYTGGPCQNGGCGMVYELTPSGSGWVEHTLYEFKAGADGAYPVGGVTFDPSGNLYGATSFDGAISTVWELLRSGSGWTFSTLCTFDVLGGPQGKPTVAAAGNVYGSVFDEDQQDSGLVYKLTPSGGGWTETNLVVFGQGNNGRFPYGSVALDANGNIYGTTLEGGSQGNGNVWEITP
jgi:uncharacterized repeat protein (TIGR03803 family)